MKEPKAGEMTQLLSAEDVGGNHSDPSRYKSDESSESVITVGCSLGQVIGRGERIRTCDLSVPNSNPALLLRALGVHN
jgi:hypothetical protein